MAQVSAVYRYDFLTNNPIFMPGDVRGVRFGPWTWFGKSLSWTVWPFDLSTATRTMEIVSIRTRTTPGSPSPSFVDLSVRNVGPDPIVIWHVFLAVMVP
jgi:hypothetical protein